MARIPSVANGLLDVGAPDGAAALAVGSPAWFAWLADDAARSFAFRSADGSYTARKEHRGRRGVYWVAYRTARGRQHKAYLGKAEELTPERLTDAAAALAGLVAGSPRVAPPAGANASATPHLPLLATKLFPPRPRPDLVARPRLLERLDAGLASARCTLLSAPAGAGKTTLLAAWLARLDRPVAWLALDERDQDPHQFLRYLIAALQTVAPACGRAGLATLDAPPPSPPEVVLTSLLNDLAALPEPCLLVLDDYHLLRTPAVHQAVVFLLDHLPPPVHLVIATREDPPLPLPRLRARGQLTEVRAADLRFDAEEAASLLRTSLGLRLPGEQVAAVVDRTEGWAAGLQLAGLALRDRSDPAAFVASFAGSHRLVADYLTAEVLDRQPPATRRFLLTTSVLDRLCAPVCDALLAADGAAADGTDAVSDSQTVLEELERANLFLVPLDEERRWYRYHQLFADALRAQLARQVGRDGAATLHGRASAWFASQGLPAEAVQHALAAGDGVLAARLIEPLARQMQVRGEMMTLLGWLGKLPEDELRARPDLGVIYAWVLAISGQVRTAERWLSSLESSLPASADAERLLAESIVIRARIALTSGEYARAVELARRALAALPDNDAALRALTQMTLAFGSVVLDDLDTAGQSFADASELYQAIGHASQAQLPLRHLAKVQLARGQLHALARTSQAALRIATASAERSRLAGYTYLSLAELAYERNDLAAAERSFTEGLELVQLGGHSEVVNLIYLVDAHLGLAKLRQVRGDGQAALDLTRQVEPLVRQMARTIEEREQAGPVRTRPWLISMLLDSIATSQVWLWLMQGNLEVANEVALERQWDLDADITLFQDRGPGLVAMARLLIAQAEYARALGVLERLLAAAHASGRVGRVIEILALQALVLQAQKDESAAVGALESALKLAEPEGYVRTFVDEGQSMAALLRKALSRGIARGYTEDLLAAFGTRDTQRRDQPAATATLEPITPRELQVLRLLADGASNAELARELVVEESTIKTHLLHLYDKLGVHSRTQAVARARALLLVD
jgi:LuxR family maltose regulon positive regulatory protein